MPDKRSWTGGIVTVFYCMYRKKEYLFWFTLPVACCDLSCEKSGQALGLRGIMLTVLVCRERASGTALGNVDWK